MRFKGRNVVAGIVVGAVFGALAATAAARATALVSAPSGRAVVVAGEASLKDNGALELEVGSVAVGRGTPTTLIGRDARLLTSQATRLVNTAGAPVDRTLLDDATIRVSGRLLPVGAWAYDDEGERLPTIRALRIVVLRLDVSTDEPDDTSPAADGAAQAVD